VGQCNKEKNSVYKGLGLFNLDTDPTESVDLSKDPAHAALFKNMSARLAAFKTSIAYSAANESECSSKKPNPTPAPPTPPTPAPATFSLTVNGKCLAAEAADKHGRLKVVACDGTDQLQRWVTKVDATSGQAAIYLSGHNKCIKGDAQDCSKGAIVWLSKGAQECTDDTFTFEKGEIVSLKCKKPNWGENMCLSHVAAKAGTQELGLDQCTATACEGWAEKTA
jgi:hypothetical protein